LHFHQQNASQLLTEEEETRMKRMGMLSLVCAGALALGCDRANDRAASNNQGPQTEQMGPIGTAGTDQRGTVRQFVLEQIADGTAEVHLGRLASEHAQSAEVKQFAQMMIQDHTKAGEHLKKLAAQYQIQAPTNLDDDHTKLMDKLSKLNGAEFDREYMSAMVDNHEHAVDALEDRAEHKADADRPGEHRDAALQMEVSKWASATVPTVRQHLERAKEINGHLGNRLTSMMKGTTAGKKD
jgi:putative membrane protein